MSAASPPDDVSLSRAEPVFIFGSPRSGTSLLSRIIDSHPEIGIPFESLLYPTLYPWLGYYGDLSSAGNRERLIRDILTLEAVRRWTPIPDLRRVLEHYHRFDFHGALDALMQAWLETQGKGRWGEKSPAHAYYWREILSGFPGAKVIHIVRDGRDAALSWKQAQFGPRHFYALAQRWVSYLETIDALRSTIDRRSFLEVHYEDLLAGPEPLARTICAFLDVEFVPVMLDFHRRGTPYPTDARNDRNLSRGLITANKDKWRTAMSARDLRIFEAVAGPALRRFGYVEANPGVTLSRREVMQIKVLEHPPTRLYGMLTNGRGYVEAARRMRIYARLLWTARGRRQ